MAAPDYLTKCPQEIQDKIYGLCMKADSGTRPLDSHTRSMEVHYSFGIKNWQLRLVSKAVKASFDEIRRLFFASPFRIQYVPGYSHHMGRSGWKEESVFGIILTKFFIINSHQQQAVTSTRRMDRMAFILRKKELWVELNRVMEKQYERAVKDFPSFDRNSLGNLLCQALLRQRFNPVVTLEITVAVNDNCNQIIPNDIHTLHDDILSVLGDLSDLSKNHAAQLDILFVGTEQNLLSWQDTFNSRLGQAWRSKIITEDHF